MAAAPEVEVRVKDLFVLADDVQEFLDSLSARFCFIGGLAVLHWGEPRLTRDVDLSIFTGFGLEEPMIDSLLAKYQPRIEDAREFALLNRVLLLQEGPIGIDISLGGLPFEERCVERFRSVEVLPGVVLKLCSPEDLIVFKAFASREIDWRDIRGVIVRQGNATLDWNYIDSNLTELAVLKEDLQIIDKLNSLRYSVK